MSMNFTGKAPGVYIQEIDDMGPISGASTSVAAFVGPAKSGDICKPTLITNWTAFTEKFGEDPESLMTYGVKGFFENGGSACYIVKVDDMIYPSIDIPGAKGNSVISCKAKKPLKSVSVEVKCDELTTLELAAEQAAIVVGTDVLKVKNAGKIGEVQYLKITQGNASEILVVKSVAKNEITLKYPTKADYSKEKDTIKLDILNYSMIVEAKETDKTLMPETACTGVSFESDSKRYFSKVIKSEYIYVAAENSIAPDNLPKAEKYPLKDSKPSENYKNAIQMLEKENINILCIPDAANLEETDMASVQNEMIAHCTNMRNRFAIIDPPKDMKIDKVKDYKNTHLASDKGYAAIYYPWVQVRALGSSGTVLVPPSGHIAGVYARVDNNRGVFKAPANETITGVLSLADRLTDDEQGPCNEEGINVLKAFAGRGAVIWGARTIAPKTSTNWRYINVRRLLLYIEQSLKDATGFAVFEPNNKSLWATLKREVTNFLTNIWVAGGLVGTSAENAFKVQIDEENNPGDKVASGILNINVSVCPTTPAEFIQFSITQTPGGSSVKE